MTDLRQLHFRFRTDAGTADASPTWGAGEDVNYYPGTANFRLRIGLRNASTVVAATPWELYVSRNGDAYTPVTTTIAKGVQSVDAGASADDTQVLIPRLYPFTADWALSGAAIDLDFANSRIYGASAFTDVLSLTRASTGYARNSAGVFSSFGNNVLRMTDVGLLVEPSRTNVVLRCRDLTNAAWTKSNATAALDQTGIDGTANSASSLLATAGNATALQAITLASSARWQSAYVKRITGSGTIQMTMDNGATWTAISPTTDWTKVEILTQTLANPTVGFRIVTSGDKIAIDAVQNEDSGSYGSSPIFTTTVAVTRAEDSLYATGSLDTLLTATAFSLVMNCPVPFIFSSGIQLFGWEGAPGGLGRGTMGFNDFSVGDNNGANPCQCFMPTGNVATLPVKVGFSCNDATPARTTVVNGGTVATEAHAQNAATPVAIGGWFTNHITSYISRFTVWNTKLADATLQSLTA